MHGKIIYNTNILKITLNIGGITMNKLNCLIQFSLENFLSFHEKQTFSMISSSDESLKNNLILFPTENFYLSSTSTIYGANASGKTNFIKAIGFLKLLLATSSQKKSNEKIFFLPFKLAKDKPTKFETHFISEGIRYFYSLSFNEDKVLEENLYTFPLKKQKKVFTRLYDEEKKLYTYDYSREFQSQLKDIETKSLQNKLFLSTASEWCSLDEIKNPISFFLDKIAINIDFLNPNWSHFTAQALESNDKIKKLFLKLLKEINPGIDNVLSKVTKKKMEMDELPSELPLELKMLLTKEETLSTDIKIQYKEKDLVLDLSEESRGIQKIFEIGGPILDILLTGKILFFDELETSLHPLLSRQIVKMFLDKNFNTKNSQLIFSTHDANLLDLDFLRRDQIWFTERGVETNYTTKLTCLSTFKGIRKGENIRKGFLQGKYTKIPFLQNLNADFYEEV